MPLVRACSRNLGQHSILTRKSTFLKKKQHQKFYPLPPFSISFVSVLHWNKGLYNFHKRGQRSIVEGNIGLEYSLLVASNSHISTALFHALWKNVNNSKSNVLAVPMTISVKVLKYFFSDKISFISICLFVVTRPQTG